MTFRIFGNKALNFITILFLNIIIIIIEIERLLKP